jgi:PBP1b-binding outer membrane lipoprotein LpoB
MKKYFATLLAALFLGGCAQMQSIGDAFSPTPEAIITATKNANTGAIALTTELLKAKQITVPQAQSYSDMMEGAMKATDKMLVMLTACRAATGSTPKTSPDPCAPSVVDVIGISLQTITDVKKALDARKK